MMYLIPYICIFIGIYISFSFCLRREVKTQIFNDFAVLSLMSEISFGLIGLKGEAISGDFLSKREKAITKTRIHAFVYLDRKKSLDHFLLFMEQMILNFFNNIGDTRVDFYIDKNLGSCRLSLMDKRSILLELVDCIFSDGPEISRIEILRNEGELRVQIYDWKGSVVYSISKSLD